MRVGHWANEMAQKGYGRFNTLMPFPLASDGCSMEGIMAAYEMGGVGKRKGRYRLKTLKMLGTLKPITNAQAT